MANDGVLQNKSIVTVLSSIAQPFVNGFLRNQRYSEAEEARLAYIQAAKGQGYDYCSDEEYRKGFFLACYYAI